MVMLTRLNWYPEHTLRTQNWGTSWYYIPNCVGCGIDMESCLQLHARGSSYINRQAVAWSFVLTFRFTIQGESFSSLTTSCQVTQQPSNLESDEVKYTRPRCYRHCMQLLHHRFAYPQTCGRNVREEVESSATATRHKDLVFGRTWSCSLSRCLNMKKMLELVRWTILMLDP